MTSPYKQYNLLSSPKTCNKAFYADYWIWEENQKQVLRNDLTKIDSLNPISKYLSASPNLQEVPLKKLIPLHKEIVAYRNNLAKEKGFNNYLELICARDKINISTLAVLNRNFKRNITNPNHFPEKIEEIFALVSQKYPLLKEFASKIQFFPNAKTMTRYQKETDSFLINFHTTQPDILSPSIVHELGHVLSILNSFKQNRNPWLLGKYANEKAATNLVFEFGLTQAYYDEFLKTLNKILFEINTYSNSQLNQEELNFLRNMDTILQPLNDLAYTLAFIEHLS